MNAIVVVSMQIHSKWSIDVSCELQFAVFLIPLTNDYSDAGGCERLFKVDDEPSNITFKLDKPSNSNVTTMSSTDAASHSLKSSPTSQIVSLPRQSVENKLSKIFNMASKSQKIRTFKIMKIPSDKDNLNKSSSLLSNFKENIAVNVPKLSENISQDKNELDTVVEKSDICIEELSVVESYDGSLRCGKDVVVSFPPSSDGTIVKPMLESSDVNEEIELLPVEIHNESLEEFDEDVLDRGNYYYYYCTIIIFN